MGAPPPVGALLFMCPERGVATAMFHGASNMWMVCSLKNLPDTWSRYFVVGSALSFFTGRKPGALPENVMAEMALSFVVLSLWVMSYSVLDVMGVGVVKMKYNLNSKTYKDYPSTEPEEVHLASRAQTNQVEQMASYIVTTLMFSFVVNGRVGGLLAFIWFLLREAYAATYRKSAGKSLQDSGIVKFTVPCYFILNGMAASVVVHLCRFAMTTM